jgi:hypothetical protein
MPERSQIIHPAFLPIERRSTAPRTKVVAATSIAIAFLIAAIAVRAHGPLTGIFLVASAAFSLLAWRVYSKLGFAGDEDDDDDGDCRDEYCV